MKLVIRFVIIVSLVFAGNFSYTETGETVNAAASAASTIGMMMMVTNSTQAGTQAPMCSSGNMGSCVVMGAALLQVVASFMNKGDSDRTADATECVGEFCNTNPTGDNGTNGTNGVDRPPGGRPPGSLPNPTVNIPRTPSPTLNNILDNAQRDLARLRNEGYEFGPDGNVTTPDGKKLNLGALGAGGGAGLAAAGFSADEIDAMNNAKNLSAKDKDKINKLLAQIASELDGAGGGGRKKGGGEPREGMDYAKLFAGLNKKDDEGSRGLAGLEKRLGRDAIGVAQDNIFHMIHRRYQTKQTTLTP